MLIPDIELKNISRYRAEQMGAAMLFVATRSMGCDVVAMWVSTYSCSLVA